MRSFSLIVIAYLMFDCVPANRKPFAGQLPDGVSLFMSGRLELSKGGDLHLILAEPCADFSRRTGSTNCDRQVLDNIKIETKAPWGQMVPGRWINASHVIFQIDWQHTGLDPLAVETVGIVSQPWAIYGMEWRPTAGDAGLMVRRISVETETETELVVGGAAPSLEVTTFEIEGGKLTAGGSEALVMMITNRGPGIAYRVTATTRSSVEALHDQRLSFGMIKPGMSKLRRLRLSVPESERAVDTMLVLVIDEGNGFTPVNASRRITITRHVPAPKLKMRCTLPEFEGERPDVDSGAKILVRCVVSNTGDATASVGGEVSIADDLQGRLPVQSIAPGANTVFHTAVSVSREIPVDSSIDIAVVARELQARLVEQAKLRVMVRKAKLCAPGKLVHDQYAAKVAKLRAALAAGDITQAQFDRYDAELIACLTVTPRAGQSPRKPSPAPNPEVNKAPVRLGGAMPSTSSGAVTSGCGTVDVGKVMKSAKSQFDAGNARVALEVVSKALQCERSQVLYRAATLYACRSQNAAAARQNITQVRPPDRAGLVQVCQAEGIKLLVP